MATKLICCKTRHIRRIKCVSNSLALSAFAASPDERWSISNWMVIPPLISLYLMAIQPLVLGWWPSPASLDPNLHEALQTNRALHLILSQKKHDKITESCRGWVRIQVTHDIPFLHSSCEQIHNSFSKSFKSSPGIPSRLFCSVICVCYQNPSTFIMNRYLSLLSFLCHMFIPIFCWLPIIYAFLGAANNHHL